MPHNARDNRECKLRTAAEPLPCCQRATQRQRPSIPSCINSSSSLTSLAPPWRSTPSTLVRTRYNNNGHLNCTTHQQRGSKTLPATRTRSYSTGCVCNGLWYSCVDGRGRLKNQASPRTQAHRRRHQPKRAQGAAQGRTGAAATQATTPGLQQNNTILTNGGI